ncbi:MAG: hypothetical protein GY708_02230 [Actinomycetia bacterium]|nr:hypothetical protein [Actinomycetes bacterium]MCP4961296.1 hypothetical protein [Actinomycetes bacterium]
MVTAVDEGTLGFDVIEELRAFVLSATTEEVVDRLARSEGRLRELDQRLQVMKELIDEAKF